MLGAAPDLEAAAPHGSTTAPAAASPVAQAVDTARTAAAVEQGSLAPLFADLAETLSVPTLPAPIRAAIAQVLALQLPAEGPIAPDHVRQAIAQSGLFLEANLASPGRQPPPDLKAALLTLRQTLPAPPPPAQAVTPQEAQPAAPPAQEATPPLQAPAPVSLPESAAPPAVLPTAQFQPARSQPGQAIPAPPSAVPPQTLTTPASPGAVVAAPGQVASPHALTAGPAAAPVLPQAAAVSPGPPQEAGPPSVPLQVPTPLDAKTALLTLQQAPPEPPVLDRPADRAPQDLRAALLNFQQAAREPATADTPPQSPRPAPPTRDAALSPQAPAPATLPEHPDLSALVEHLAPQVEQALARLTLHQLASCPTGRRAPGCSRSRSPRRRGPPWRSSRSSAMARAPEPRMPQRRGAPRFSVDIEPLGPVHVHVAMSGGKAAVSVWAERIADSLAWLRRPGGAELAGALLAEVVFRTGTPGGTTPARGHFLDQTS